MKSALTRCRLALTGKAIATLIVISLVVIGVVFVINQPQELPLEGEFNATRVIVSLKITG